MDKIFSNIKDISIYNSKIKSNRDLIDLYNEGFFSDESTWKAFRPENKIPELGENINSRLRNRMSQLSLGIYTALEAGPGKNISNNEEICLFTGFGEIETTREIIKNIVLDKYLLVSPTLFHNSVHHTSLGYYTIIRKTNNPCVTISDGLDTGRSFVEYINRRVRLDKNLVVTAGEEYSSFFELDRINPKTIVPSFAAYRVERSDYETGFLYHSKFDSIDYLKESELFKNSENIIAGRELFLKLKKSSNKNILCEYPLIYDDPLGIIFRLTFPFLFNLKGTSLVLEECSGAIHTFEVILK